MAINRGTQYFLKNKISVFLEEAYSKTTVNCGIFRYHGLVTDKSFQFTAFYKSQREIVIVRRAILTGEIERATLPGNYNLKDAHNTISLGIDVEGYIHMSYNQHASKLYYRRSQSPWLIEKWSDEQDMTGNYEDKVTYPTFISPTPGKTDNISLYFLYRYGTPGGGEARLKWLNFETGSWADVEAPLLSGSQCKPWPAGPYWNHPVIDKDGCLCLSFMWRCPPTEDERVNNNHLSYARFTQDFKFWETQSKYRLKLPITPLTNEVIIALPIGSNLINQTSMALNSKGYPHIAFYVNDTNGIPQYQHLYWTGRKWKNNLLTKRKSAFSLIGRGTLALPISRPVILIDRIDRVYVIFQGDLTEHRLAALCLQPPDYSVKKSKLLILTEESLGNSEPVIDFHRWQHDNILSVLIQATEQPYGDNNSDADVDKISPIKIVEWNFSDGMNPFSIH
jgi:BNR repeat-containing family member